MAQLQKTVATLRIFGDDLIPEEITRILRIVPTYSQIKGQELVGRKTGNVRIAKTGTWQIGVSDQEPGNLDAQVREIFGQLTDDLDLWQGIVARYKVDLFFGFFYGQR